MKNIVKWSITTFILLLCASVLYTTNAHAEEANSSSTDVPSSGNPDRTTKWEGTPYVTDTAEQVSSSSKLRVASASDPIIADISHHQGVIDWAKASKVLDLVIIRTQDGSAVQDTKHAFNEESAIKYNVPFGVYAFSRATDVADAKVEARDFYKRANKNAKFYVVDVETISGSSAAAMKGIINSYVAELRSLTNKKVGLYIAHHLYDTFKLDTSKFDFVWIPRYGTTQPNYVHQLWQYTDRGTVNGITGGVDLSRLASGVSLSYFTKDVGQISDAESYYDVNPVKIATKKALKQYKTTTISDENLATTVAKNTILDVANLAKSNKGVTILKLKNGNYISANKKDSVKTISSLANYLTVVPKKVMLLKDATSYKNTSFTTANKVKTYTSNTVLTVKDIDYTASGTPRLKLSDGSYISANTSLAFAVTSGVLNYHYINPKYVMLNAKLNLYTDVDLKVKSGKQYAIGQVLKIQDIEWTTAGVPRLKLGTNQYVTAGKSSSIKVRSDIKNYITTVPKKVVLLKAQSAYKTTNFVDKNIVSNAAVNTVFTIDSIVYTSGGTPRLKTTSGTYISAKKTDVQHVLSSIKNYIYVNPKKVLVTKAINVYTTPECDVKTGKNYKVGSFIKVQEITFSESGVPRLKIGKNQYITANKLNVQQVVNSIGNYYYINPSTVVTLQKINVYSAVDFKKKTGKVYKTGAKIKVIGIEWTAAGTPRLKLSTGQYITAKLVYYK